jgi:hypothetical protein
MAEKPKASLDTACDSLVKYYMYTLNEASLGLYFSQFISKKVIKEMYDSEVALEKTGAITDLNKYNNLAKTMEMESRELGSLKDDWAARMSEKLQLLTK